MRTSSIAVVWLLAAVETVVASHENFLARRHMHGHQLHKKHIATHELTKRATCQFPSDKGLVAVTPGAQNAGWAMSPDQPCLPYVPTRGNPVEPAC